MDTPTQPMQASQEFVYLPVRPPGTNVSQSYAAAIALLIAGVIGFLVSIYIRVDILTRQLMSTLPFLGAIRMFQVARGLKSVPREVVASPAGLRITSLSKVDTYAWQDLSLALFGSNSYTNKREVQLFDQQGKRVARLDETLQYFDHLRSVIEASVPGKSPVGTGVRIQKARATGAFLLIGGIGFLALSIACMGFAREDQRAARLMKTSLVPGLGTITHRFIAPNGVTTRIEYTVKSPDGKVGSHNAEVSREYYDQLSGVKTVPVMYVPSDPDITRLAAGEIPDSGNVDPSILIPVVFLVGAMSLIFIVAGILSLTGCEMYMSKSTGRPAIKNFGEPSV